MQHPAKGIPSPNSNLDLEAMKVAQSAAISSNEKAFPIFAKKLASGDTKEYTNTARKLATWLGSEKAYYPGARPKIVELLEIALSAFMDIFVHHPGVAEFAQLLQRLIQTVVPFVHLFSENDLNSRLQHVILQTERSLSKVPSRLSQDNVPPPGTATADMPPLTVTSPVQVQVQVQVQLQPTTPPTPGSQTLVSQRQSVPLDAAEAVSDLSFHPDIPQAHNPAETVALPSLPSKPQPKRARIAKLPEELIARDLDWFKSNQASVAVNEDPDTSLSNAGESSLAQASDTAYIPRKSPSPKKKTARMVPSRRLPRPISLDATRMVESSISTFALTPDPSRDEPRTFDNTKDVSAQNDNQQQSSPERNEHDARSAATLEASHMLGISLLHEDLPSSELQLVATSMSESPTRQHSAASSDRLESMDISVSSSERVSSESPRKFTAPQSPQAWGLQSPILPPLVGAWEPSLNLNFNISQISPQHSTTDVIQQRFDDEMTVIHSTQGKTFTHTHKVDINLDDNIFAKISSWINRKSHPSEAPHGVCISLACYRLPEVFDKTKLESGTPGIEVLTLRSSCCWPPSNRLSLHVDRETRQTIIALDPPLFLTPDRCVDISSLMKPGDNTLEFRQHGDLSEYLIVLHAHRPTRAQLAELDAVITADERWRRFLEALSARVAPEKVHGATPAGVVGVF